MLSTKSTKQPVPEEPCPICQGKGAVLSLEQLMDSVTTRTEEHPWVEGHGLPAVYFVCAGCDGQATLAAYTARVLAGEYALPKFVLDNRAYAGSWKFVA